MTKAASAHWKRSVRSLESARRLMDSDPDSAASRAYYAVFHAVSGLFAVRGQSFTKHAQLRSAVHRDLVKSGEWSRGLGSDFDDTIRSREMGDYGIAFNVSRDDALHAIDAAARILEKVRESHPDIFTES